MIEKGQQRRIIGQGIKGKAEEEGGKEKWKRRERDRDEGKRKEEEGGKEKWKRRERDRDEGEEIEKKVG